MKRTLKKHINTNSINIGIEVCHATVVSGCAKPGWAVPGGAARDPLHGGPGAGRHLAGRGRAVRPRPRHPRGGGHPYSN